jgi:hypothetical protein
MSHKPVKRIDLRLLVSPFAAIQVRDRSEHPSSFGFLEVADPPLRRALDVAAASPFRAPALRSSSRRSARAVKPSDEWTA